MFRKIKSCFNKQSASNAISLCIAIAFYLVLSNLGAVKSVMVFVKKLMAPFIWAFALAFILNKPEKALEKSIFKKFKKKKALSVFTVFILFFVLIGALLLLVLPEIGQSLSIVAEMAPVFFTNVYEYIMKLLTEYHFSENLTSQLEALAKEYSSSISNVIMMSLSGIYNFSVRLGNGVVKLLMALITTLYMLLDKDRLKFTVKKALYAFCEKKTADGWIAIARKSENIFSDFIIGKMLDSLIIGIICFFGMLFIYHDYAVLIAVIIGVTNMIPFFGPFIGAIPSIFILLMSDPFSALIFTVFVLVLQQLDGNIIGPKILGDSLGLSALWILVAIVLGNGLFGFVGMIIGVPTFRVLYNLTSEYTLKKLKEKDIEVHYDTNSIEFKE